MERMEVYPLKSRLLRPGDSLDDSIVNALRSARLRLRNGDLIAVASKVVAVSEGNIVRLSSVRPSRKARELAHRYKMDPRFVQIVLDESDKVYSGVRGALLTQKDGDAVANAGADQKNAPVGYAVLWPRNSDRTSRELRAKLGRRYGKKLGVLIVDSRVTPLRLGTIGLALGSAGFPPIRDLRGSTDLYGRRARITVHALADGLASVAHLVMGESKEQTPFVLIRNSPAVIDGRNRSRKNMLLPAKECLYMSNIIR
jgi:coenzyme F420-0:L-glutamate ligase / coenzyme F420-1:gamma-L-glutamate ligase